MFRKPELKDREILAALIDEFYHSDGVLHPIPKAYIQRTLDALFTGNPFIKAYMIEKNHEIAGYALLALTWSNEGGGLTLWIEELYILPQFQGQGLGKAFFHFLHQEWDGKIARFRLETEPGNEKAHRLYEELGYEAFPYLQMIREPNPITEE